MTTAHTSEEEARANRCLLPLGVSLVTLYGEVEDILDNPCYKSGEEEEAYCNG